MPEAPITLTIDDKEFRPPDAMPYWNASALPQMSCPWKCDRLEFW